MPALQHFLRDELLRRDWSIEEFARRSSMSTSRGYQIVRDGQDNVRQDTFDNIASALGFTPAHLATAIGKGRVDENPRRALLYALVSQVAEEDIGTVERVVRPFAVIPPLNQRLGNGPRDGTDTRQKRGRRQIESHNLDSQNPGLDGGLPSWNRRLVGLYAFIVRRFAAPTPQTASMLAG